MLKTISKTGILWVVLALILTACGGAAPEAEATQVDPNAVYTAAAQTANAKMTELLATTPATATLEPTATLQPTEALPPTATLSLTGPITGSLPGAPGTATIPGAAGTPGLNATAAPVLATTPAPAGIPPAAVADRMEFVADLTIPDGTVFAPNAEFTKTWRLKNAGTTTWTPQYALVFVTGTQMGTTASVNLPVNVAPGETIDLSVNMVAPATDGNYFSYWMMKNTSGQNFGLGPNGDGAVYVNVVVGVGSTTGVFPTPNATTGASTSPSANSPIQSISLSVDEAIVDDANCPHTFSFTAVIEMKERAEVSFAFNGDSSDTGFNFRDLEDIGETITLPKGTYDYNFTVTAEQSFTGSVTMVVFSPQNLTSQPVQLILSCSRGSS